MNRHKPILSRFALVFGLPLVGLTMTGCGGQTEPTKIYEGGGTIPEIVDQPEPGEAKKETPAKK
jgi:hypothetical protein